ncbi:MAG: AbrB/MazE/SpoVT family DNA-binding domain-containing protein [Gammaproteobacteria bacterium]|nr:AbrB/MazE/SpoVT family DNA-binding domain-containing protein [Gammaproteobacteria bacterium]
MPVLSPKRQITLPKELCDRLGVNPGDDLDLVEHNGRITVLKKVKGASAGVLKHLKADKRYSDDDSLQDAVAKRRTTKGKRNAA